MISDHLVIIRYQHLEKASRYGNRPNESDKIYSSVIKEKRHENKPIESDKTLLLSYIAKSVKKIFRLKVPKLNKKRYGYIGNRPNECDKISAIRKKRHENKPI